MSRFMTHVISTDIITSGCSRSKRGIIMSEMSYAYSNTERKTFFALTKACLLQTTKKREFVTSLICSLYI
jgi:hypothetical protein